MTTLQEFRCDVSGVVTNNPWNYVLSLTCAVAVSSVFGA